MESQAVFKPKIKQKYFLLNCHPVPQSALLEVRADDQSVRARELAEVLRVNS